MTENERIEDVLLEAGIIKPLILPQLPEGIEAFVFIPGACVVKELDQENLDD